MQKIFKGRVVGNNIRQQWPDNITPSRPIDVFTSLIEVETDDHSFGGVYGRLSHFETGGFYKIGSTVTVELTIKED